jgi:hypothetical protein
MSSSVYSINKGVNKPLEFRGLKAQYIAWLAIGLVVLLLLFSALYLLGISMLICLPLILVLGSALFYTVFRLSHKYGRYGLLKKAARKSLPRTIRVQRRQTFYDLQQKQ